MKSSMEYCNYDKESHTSIVVYNTELGHFKGLAFLHPEDMEFESSFFGCDIAERRAVIKYHKERLKIKKAILKEFKNLYKEMSTSKRFVAFSYEACRLRKKMYQLNNEIIGIADTIKTIEEGISKDSERRISTLKKIRNKKREDKTD